MAAERRLTASIGGEQDPRHAFAGMGRGISAFWTSSGAIRSARRYTTQERSFTPVELSEPGSAHEEAGYELLLWQGFDEELARFARTHAAWNHADVQVEDLLVSVSDKVWKGKRVDDLEQLLIDVLASATGRSKWETFMELDDVLGHLPRTLTDD
jgi:hypothetical protein